MSCDVMSISWRLMMVNPKKTFGFSIETSSSTHACVHLTWSRKEWNEILISICHIKTISLGIVSETPSKTQHNLGHIRNPVSAFSALYFLNSICRVFSFLLWTHWNCICVIYLFSLFSLLGVRSELEWAREGVHIHFISFTTHIARWLA